MGGDSTCPACPACSVAYLDGTGPRPVGPEDRTGPCPVSPEDLTGWLNKQGSSLHYNRQTPITRDLRFTTTGSTGTTLI